MRTFKASELKTFEQLVSLRQGSLKKLMASFLKRYYPKVIETKFYITCEGEIPIGLVAHLDTVFPHPPKEVFFDPCHNVLYSPQGLGADDRAGVFAIIKIVQSGLRPHIILTTDEELGGLGANQLGLQDCPFKDLRYLIELDRRGSDDCVFYDCDNKDFADYIENFGFTTAWGSFSDISILCPDWGIAGVNLSVGYRDEHSRQEVLFVGQLLSTIEKVKAMLQEKDIPKFDYMPGPYYHFWDITNSKGNKLNKCCRCRQYFMEEELIPTLSLNGKDTKFYCSDCVVDNVSWCAKCGNAFETPGKTNVALCPNCEKEHKNV